MKKILSVLLIIILGLSSGVFAIINENDFNKIILTDNLGNVTNSNDIKINLVEGWNLLPLEFIANANGEYHGNYKKGKTCNQDVFQNIWMYSPVSKDYYHIPVFDDWQYPKTRNNNFLLNEFKSNYFHIFAGSGWVYSNKKCILETSYHGVKLLRSNYNDEAQGKMSSYKKLILKTGWNLVPIDRLMVISETSLDKIFDGCGVQKYNLWDNKNQKWILSTEEMNKLIGFNEKININDIFKTVLIKTSSDCYLGDNIFKQYYNAVPSEMPNN